MTGAHWRVRAEIWIWRHGWAWPLAALVALAGVASHFWLLQPAEREWQEARERARTSALNPRPVRVEEPTLARLQEPLRAAPPAPELARKMAALAQVHGVATAQADYQTLGHGNLGLTQLQVVQPVRASYPQFRRYVEAVLREVPSASLDHVSARREHVGQGQLDIRLRWSFWQAGVTSGEAK